MNNHKTLYMALAVVGALAVSASTFAQQDQTTTTTTTVTTQATGQPLVMTTEGNRISVGDRIFLMDLVHANAREIELSRVAFHQSNSTEISRFAHHMLMAHRALQDQLMTTYGERPFLKSWQGAVSQSNMAVADNWGGIDTDKPNYNNWAFLYSDDWSQIRQLRNQNGINLERIYVQSMATDHANLLVEINRRDAETDNSDIKALIANVRPVVEEHLRRARDWKFDLSENMTLNGST